MAGLRRQTTLASPGHTYGPTCLLQTESNAFTRRASEASTDAPRIKAQFFYCSTLPIDDPLSPVPPPPTPSAPKSSKVPPRPFSVHDNRALEDAWLKSQKEAATDGRIADKKPPSALEHVVKRITQAHERAAAKDKKDSERERPKPQTRQDMIGTALSGRPPPAHSQMPTREPQGPAEGDPDLTLVDDPAHIPFDETMPVGSEEIGNDEFDNAVPRRRRSSFFRRREKAEEVNEANDKAPYRKLPASKNTPSKSKLGSSPSERDTTGTPFLRVPSALRRSRSRSPRSRERLADVISSDGAGEAVENQDPNLPQSTQSPRRPHSSQSDDENGANRPTTSRSQSSHRKQKVSQQKHQAHVIVGMLRLHVVEMPGLKMGPIYWDPRHDVSSVARGTWFYKETMWPLESDIANQIEEGYEYMKPWTPTYVDELNSCMEIGPEAELKIVHKLWPESDESPNQSRPGTGKSKGALLSTEPSHLEPDDQDRQEALVVAGLSENRAAGFLDGFYTPGKHYQKASIIYANGRDAQILKPNQLPSVKMGRKVLGYIRKGKAVGIPVVRGFDVRSWEKLNPPLKVSSASSKARESARALRSVTTISPEGSKSCIACETSDEKPKPTDLVLVIHGIGQKLSERVESFHFTHNINSFRRQVNMELEADAVKPFLRQDLGGVMVLPVNWRSTLRFEDGGPDPNPNRKGAWGADPTENEFRLKDITAESIPAVRNLISDVMLDIPYYLSHHKPKMIQAVTREANRIYRLWCLNNPGFHEKGRVHVIAHSLGSIMALDVLSKQPTKLHKPLDFKTTKVCTDMFEFDTKSLFFCGSPAGFFLLLNKASLIPRKGRDKPEAEGEDTGSKIAGEPGTYGCLAVDNLYNVSHHLDPVAYRLNACVDVDYAASLQPQSVPSATASWGQYIGSIFRSKSIAPTKAMTGLDSFPRRPTTTKMPSTVEMETHNFTKEEIAEKRMFLLNDNGQIDYTLHSGGGPLEIQYLNMLGAHSSYWILQDFVRFLVIEIGRQPGKTETLNSIKAKKKPFGKK